MDEDRNEHYEYFAQKPSKWDIIEFLEQCDLEPYGKKVDRYIRCLRCIARGEQKKRKEKAEELLRRYSKIHSVLDHSRPFAFFATAESQNQCWSTDDPCWAQITLQSGNKPDQQRVKDWEKTRKSSKISGGSSVHIHHSTLSGSNLSITGNGSTKATTKRKREGLRERKVISYAESSTDKSSDSNCEESRS
ncbi:11976_t:CDS:2, partial [Acaulospora morrowiae]